MFVFISCTPSEPNLGKVLGESEKVKMLPSNSSVGSFATLTDLSVAEGGTATTQALNCSDGTGGTPNFTVTESSPNYGNCSLTTSGANSYVTCNPNYNSGHATNTSVVTVRCILNSTNYYSGINVTIADTNRAPTLSTINAQTIYTGASMTQITGIGSELDGDALTYSCTFSGGGFAAGTNCTSLPGSSVSFNTTNGTFDWTTDSTSAVANATTAYTITYSATDGTLTTSQNVTMTVVPAVSFANVTDRKFSSSNPLTSGSAFSYDFNNLATNSDAAVTYSCVYDTTVDGAVAAGSACSGLAGTSTLAFNTLTGTFAWTPYSYAEGSYEFKITGTKAGFSTGIEIFVIELKRGYSQTNLVTELDAKYSNLTTNHSSGAATSSAPWQDLQHPSSSNYDGTFLNTVSQSWGGTGTSTDPYYLLFSPVVTWPNTVDLGASVVQDLNTAGKMLFSTWIKPTSPSTSGTVILQNGDSTNGFILRQSASSTLELTVGGTGSSPIVDSSLKVWVKSNAGITLNGGNVSAWADQSGLGNNASQGTAASQPLYVANAINGYPVLRFDGTDDYLSLPDMTMTDITVFIVGKGTNGTFYGDLGGCGGGYPLRYFQTSGSQLRGYSRDCTNRVDKFYGNLGDTSNYFQGVYQTNGSTLNVKYNGTTNTTTYADFTADDLTGYAPTIGTGGGYIAGYYLTGDIAEVIVYNRTLSASEISIVQEYLYGKYNVGPSTESTCRTNSKLYSNNWYHVAGYFDGSATSLYLNGHKQCTGNIGTNFAYTSNSLFMGGADSIGTNAWSGAIAEFMMYSNGSVSAITNLYNTTYQRYDTALDIMASAKIWLDASDTSTLYTTSDCTTTLVSANNDVVKCWKDKTTNANHAIQATTGNAPLFQTNYRNYASGVKFDGSNDYFDISTTNFPSGSSARTIITVFKATNINNRNFVISYGALANGQLFEFEINSFNGGAFNGDLGIHLYDDGFETLPNNYPVSSSTPKVYSGIYKGGAAASSSAQFLFYANGTSYNSELITGAVGGKVINTTLGNGKIGVRSGWGGSPYINGTLLELLYFDRELTSTERQTVENYLNSKYSLY